MAFIKAEIRTGAYYDSAFLMQLQRTFSDLPGIQDAGVVMGTETNKELLARIDLLSFEIQAAKPDDLVIVVRADNEASAVSALGRLDELLSKRRSAIEQEYQPHSIESAEKMVPDASWVLISVAGRYAGGVARDALSQGKHVFLFSDNVSVEEEIELKKIAAEKGLLVMGPDCGTAIVAGMGLGFANKVRLGPIGVVAAAGTGLQQARRDHGLAFKPPGQGEQRRHCKQAGPDHEAQHVNAPDALDHHVGAGPEEGGGQDQCQSLERECGVQVCCDHGQTATASSSPSTW